MSGMCPIYLFWNFCPDIMPEFSTRCRWRQTKISDFFDQLLSPIKSLPLNQLKSLQVWINYENIAHYWHFTKGFIQIHPLATSQWAFEFGSKNLGFFHKKLKNRSLSKFFHWDRFRMLFYLYLSHFTSIPVEKVW